ncbi:MAG: Tad domain-containing protein [Candidatus Thiodiazotropha sp.]
MPEVTRRKQKGQALPLGIALLVSSVLFALVLFNTGQTASEKSRLTNTADAAAYSGLIWQARALNFQAYTNRAMVANHVSIGQMVSLTSWTKYAYILARNIDYIGRWFPIVGAVTAAAKQFTNGLDNVMVTIAEVFIPVVDNLNAVLSQSQRAIYLASFAATPAIVSEVVEKNDSRYNATSAYALIGMGENAVKWNNFATRYDDNESHLRNADVVNRSKDEFTQSRNFTGGRINLGVVKVWLKKEGESRLVSEESSPDTNYWFNNNNNNSGSNLEWEWKGKDTYSFHIKVLKWDGWDHDEVPLGWGSRYVNGDFECDETEYENRWWWFGSGCTRYLDENRRAEMLADGENEELDVNYEGIRAYYDLADLSQNNKDPRLALRIQVELPQDEVRTASKIEGVGSTSVPNSTAGNGLGQGVFGTEDRMAGGGMAAISSGELFFHPPDDYLPENRRGRYEIASLFSPYWEVRLAKTPIQRRFMAWALRDSSLITQGASGVVDGVDRFISDKTEELERLYQIVEDLQRQIENATNGTLRTQLENQLSLTNAEITQLQSINVDTSQVSAGLQQGLSQGLSHLGNANVNHYQQMLNNYAAQQGQSIVNDFENQIVDQVTDQMHESLENAMENAVENAMSSML